MMQRIVDTSAILWNSGLYFRFKPKPIKEVNLVQQLDSVPLNGEQRLVFNVSQPGNWILLYKYQNKSPVLIRVQDGDTNLDLESLPSVVEIKLDRRNLSGVKIYEILAAESNYPIYMVNEELIKKAIRIQFKVY